MKNRIATALILALGLVAGGAFAALFHGPHLTEDSYQYLDAAHGLASEGCLCTRVALFDEQVAHGRMPIPFTHFAPGYPILIAGLTRIGLGAVTAGLWLSIAGFAIALWLLQDIGRTLGARAWALAAVSALWLGNYRALWDATSVATESLFSAAIMAVAALMARDVRQTGKRPLDLILIGACAGAAYDIRYAGLFILPVAGLYLLWRFLRTPASRAWAASGMAVAAVLAGAVLVRNMAESGSWRGGFNGSAHRPVREVLAESAKAYYHLLFGDAVAARRDIWAALFCAGFAVLLYCMVRAAKQRQYRSLPGYAPLAAAWLAVLAAAYLAGIVLTALLTIAADMTRYNRPIYPLLLALAAPLLSIALQRWWKMAAVAVVVGVVAINARAFAIQPPPGPDAVAAQLLGRDVQPGVSGAEWLRSHVQPGAVLFSAYGQGVHYDLDRDVVAFLYPPFTSRPVDADSYRREMTQFHARYMLLFPGLPPDVVPDQDEVPFLRGLAAGNPPPPWLREDAHNGAIAIYECSSCAQ